MVTDPYTVLGLQPSASAEEIRNAYRKLARKYHPDLNPGNAKAEAKFKEVNNANELLGSPEKRAKFDRGEIDATGAPVHPQHERPQGGPFYYETQHDGGRYASAFGGFSSELFEELLRRQSDEHYVLEVDFREAILGGEKELSLPSGKSIKVRIPPGVESGKTLRLRGLGAKANEAADPSDVYIEIKVSPSHIFTRNGQALEMEVPITLYEAVLGAEIKVPTLEKPVLMKVPPRSATGSKLRIKGKGVPAARGSTRGDLIVTLKLVMPPHVDSKLEEAIRNAGSSHPYNPREQLENDGGVR